MEQNRKKMKKTAGRCPAAAIMAAILVLSAGNLAAVQASDINLETNAASLELSSASAVEAYEGEEGSAAPQTLDDVAKIYSFSVDGNTVSLPASVEDMKAAGFGFDGYSDEDKLQANAFAGIYLSYNGSDAYKSLKADIYGDKTDRVPFKDGKIARISIDKDREETMGIEFKTADGIAVGDPVQKVLDLYGTPTNDNGKDLLNYFFTTDMAKKGLIEEAQKMSPATDKLAINYDGDGIITAITMAYLPE